MHLTTKVLVSNIAKNTWKSIADTCANTQKVSPILLVTIPIQRYEQPWPYVQIWTSCVKTFESYRLTDRQTRPKLYTTPPSRVVKNGMSNVDGSYHHTRISANAWADVCIVLLRQSSHVAWNKTDTAVNTVRGLSASLQITADHGAQSAHLLLVVRFAVAAYTTTSLNVMLSLGCHRPLRPRLAVI